MNKRTVAILFVLTALFTSSCAPENGSLRLLSSVTIPPTAVATEAESRDPSNPSDSILPEKPSTTATSSGNTTPAADALSDTANLPNLTFDEAMMFNPYGYAVVGVKTDGVMKYGMIGEDGAYVVAPEYDAFRTAKSEILFYLPDLDNGYTWLKKNGLWGFVNEKCEWVAKPSYEDCTCFASFGLAGVKVNGKWGFISTAGKIAVESTYDDVRVYDNTLYAQVKKDGKWGLIDATGKEVLSPMSSSNIFANGNDYNFGFWDGNDQDVALINDESCLVALGGRVIVDNANSSINGIGPNLLVYANSSVTGNGYYNLNGDLVIPLADGEEGSIFTKDNVALVMNISNLENITCRMIDDEGNTLFGRSFDNMSFFDEQGLASVEIDGKWGYIDKTGSFVIEPQFESVGAFQANGLAAAEVDGKWGYIDKTGAFAVQPEYDEVNPDFYHNYAYVRLDGKSALIDSKGTLLTGRRFDWIDTWPICCDSKDSPIFIASENGKQGLINVLGEWVLSPQYDAICHSTDLSEEGYTLLCYTDDSYLLTLKDGKFGILSLEGDVLVEAANEEGVIEIAPNGCTVVCRDGVYNYVDLDG